jgi:hypothetical protein
VVADFRREYHMTGAELAALSADEFTWLLSGLSDDSRLRQAWHHTPKHVYDPDEIAAIREAARR